MILAWKKHDLGQITKEMKKEAELSLLIYTLILKQFKAKTFQILYVSLGFSGDANGVVKFNVREGPKGYWEKLGFIVFVFIQQLT